MKMELNYLKAEQCCFCRKNGHNIMNICYSVGGEYTLSLIIFGNLYICNRKT